VKEIPLNRGFVAVVDDEDYEWLMQWKWTVLKRPKTFYAVRTIHLKKVNGKWKSRHVSMHRAVAARARIRGNVDHWDTNGLHNWRTNLRSANKSQNGANRGLDRNNTSGFKGVSFANYCGLYRSKIYVNGKQIHLCYSSQPEECARAYDAAAMRFFGPFARLNFPSA
jgi:hypothetical protein